MYLRKSIAQEIFIFLLINNFAEKCSWSQKIQPSVKNRFNSFIYKLIPFTASEKRNYVCKIFTGVDIAINFFIISFN